MGVWGVCCGVWALLGTAWRPCGSTHAHTHTPTHTHAPRWRASKLSSSSSTSCPMPPRSPQLCSSANKPLPLCRRVPPSSRSSALCVHGVVYWHVCLLWAYVCLASVGVSSSRRVSALREKPNNPNSHNNSSNPNMYQGAVETAFSAIQKMEEKGIQLSQDGKERLLTSMMTVHTSPL